MIKTLYHSLVFFALFVFFSCSDKEKEENNFKLNLPENNNYASYFKVYKQDGFSVLITYLNVDKTDSAIYVLYSKEKPELNLDAKYLKTPVERIACLGSVFVGFLNRISVLEKIRAVDNIDFISNAEILYLNAEGSVKQLSKTGQLNIEETLLSGVQLILTNPSGDKKRDFDKRLLDAGIIPIVCADYFENHPLGRAEWIKVFSLLVDKEKQGDSLFAETERKYLELKRSTDTCSYKPTVFTEKRTNDAWFVAGGKSSVAQLLNDAGANYLWKNNEKTGATALSMELVIQKALSADYWINLHLCASLNDLQKMDERYSEFNAFKKGNVFNNNALMNKTGGNAYWENGLCNPDEILRDLVKIFHPNLQPDYQLKYYKQLK